jgi:HSP20 family protein
MLLRSATVRDLDRLTARVFESTGRSSGCRLNAYRIDDDYHIDIELPGVDPAGIEVRMDEDVLTVRAERKPSADEEPTTPGADDRPIGPVTRQVTLSDRLDTDRLDARYETGVLTLRIPLREKAGAAV